MVFFHEDLTVTRNDYWKRSSSAGPFSAEVGLTGGGRPHKPLESLQLSVMLFFVFAESS